MNEKKKHPLDEIVWGVLPIANYKGAHVTKQPNNLYSIWGHVNLLPHEVDEYIDKSLMTIGRSIKQD